MRFFAIRLLALLGLTFVVVSCTTASVEYEREPRVHPAVFAMMECWLSDTTSPVVTEINLDAVAANRNQFDEQAIRDNDGWVSCPGEDGHGFLRYRYEPSEAGTSIVRFQHNGGGSLTTSALIGFQIVGRQIHVDGQATTVRVLRVVSYSVELPGE